MNQILEINVSEKDFSTFSNYAYYRLCPQKSGMKSFLINVVMWCLVGMAVMFMLQWTDSRFDDLHWPSVVIGALPFLAGMIAFVYNNYKLKKLAFPNPNGLILGPKTVAISADGIKESSANGDSFFTWKTVNEVANNKGDLYVFVDKTMAVIIPSSSFSSSDEIAQFQQTIENYRQ